MSMDFSTYPSGGDMEVPLFLDLGYRVICPDCCGYGRSVGLTITSLFSEPVAHSIVQEAPTDSIIPYTFKSLADDIVQIAKQLDCENIIVGGHDWGAMVAYKMAFWHPEFVTHIFTVCVPYSLPSPQWVEFEFEIDATIFPTLGYQAQFSSGLIEQKTQSADGIRHSLTALYGGQSKGQSAMSAFTDVDFEKARHLSRPQFVNEEEMEYHVHEFSRNGLTGPCNFYRNWRQNFEDDLPFSKEEKRAQAVLEPPTLFLYATEDVFIRPEMTKGMLEAVSHLTVVDIEASHWILWQKPEEVNEALRHWFDKQGLASRNPRTT
ncbi:uncharacterized protein N7477_003160 [Penicillium maclennaniae]|uniref:uncharacterized protein n=1 Tax=Penicillium maclennaniae TaxID=1343394 RepID=UPI002541854A|nr:uncharacterized protein N7477_003160 [Penicillium maclennaniae]KAJ5677527.1 hypothetical protein N7477_003160 [Penicillium maclennaniae]